MAKKWKQLTDFIFLGSKITANVDCSHDIKKTFGLWKESNDKPRERKLKSRDIALLTKLCSQNYVVFAVVMYGCESWIIKKAECQRIDAFELWCWRRLLRMPWTARRSNQSILKEINPEYHRKDWSWSSNTLATWSEESTHWKRPQWWERLKAIGEGGSRGWDG